MNILEHNRSAWNKCADESDQWTIPVTEDDLINAKNGKWDVVLTPTKSVPKEWFPNLRGLKILGLASGGGQQCPLLAALGADVTLLDNSDRQLERDRELSERYNLGIKTIQGDMRDLSVFADESFDLIFNPCSLLFIDEINKVWKECFRVLGKNGILMAGLVNPMVFQSSEISGNLIIAHKRPYSDLNSLPKEQLDEKIANREPLEFAHSLSDQIGGQLKAGFMLTDFFEDDWGGKEDIDQYLPGFMATRAIKYEC